MITSFIEGHDENGDRISIIITDTPLYTKDGNIIHLHEDVTVLEGMSWQELGLPKPDSDWELWRAHELMRQGYAIETSREE